MSLNDLIYTLNMTGNGSKTYDIPAGYNYMTIFNTSDNTITGYLGSDASGQLIFQWNLFTGQTVPMKAGTEVYISWVNGDSVQSPKPVQVVFSVGNLGVSTTFGNSSGSQMTLAVDSVGLTRGTQLPSALSGGGNLKIAIEEVIAALNVAVSNFPATQPVSGTVGISNFPATQPISGTVGVNNFPATQMVDEAGWSWQKVTAAGAGDVTVKGGAGKVAQMIPDTSEVIYLKDGTAQAWKTGSIAADNSPIACSTSIVINFASAGNAWILYK